MSADSLMKSRRSGNDPKGRDWRDHVAATLRELEQFRGSVHLQLDALEEMARQRAGGGSSGSGSSEEIVQLKQQIGELEATRERLEREANGWKAERQELMDLLEHDRKQIADAWDALERERIQKPQVVTPRPPDRPEPEPASKAERPAAPPAPEPATARRGSGSGSDDQVTLEILRQFQSLRRDVRRTTQDRST